MRNLKKKTDLWFGKCYEEFGKFSPEYLKVSKLRLWWDPFIQSKKCMSLKSAVELCVMTKKNIAKFLRETDLLFQNWLKEFSESWPGHPKILKICTLMGSCWLKHIIRAPHWVRLVRFLPYQIFLIKMSFFIILFYSNSIVKLTFHIYPPLLLFNAKVERQRCSIAIFYSFFLRLMQCNDLIYKLNMKIKCFIYIRRLQTCVIIRRSSTTKTKYSNHWAM